MVKYHAPRRGSLGFRRKRAIRIYPRVFTWPKVDEVRLLAFPAYKVGMISVQERNLFVGKRAMWYGIERTVAATVLEAPPIRILGIRGYKKTLDGLKSIIEAWTPYYSKFERKYLQRKIQLPKKSIKELSEILDSRLKSMSKLVDSEQIHEIRIIARTSPELTTIGKKKPEILEIKVGGKIKDALKWAVENLGKFVRVTDVIEPTMFVDVIGVTKGKGFQGVVKRFGVKLLPPKSKKGYRRIGTLGPWTPGRIMWTVPRPGQLGFFRRTEYNKQIMLIIPSAYSIKYKFNESEDEPYSIQLKDKITIGEEKEGDKHKEEKEKAESEKNEKAEKQKEEKKKVIDLKAFYYGREKVFDSDKIGLVFEILRGIHKEEKEKAESEKNEKAERQKEEKQKEEKKKVIDNPVKDLNPRGGWPHYGVIRNDAIIIRGSCVGPPKRLIILRWPVRTDVLKKGS